MKLKLFLFVFGTIILRSHLLGQIQYTNLNPDSVFNINGYSDVSRVVYFDLNNDSIDDFKFVLTYWFQSITGTCCEVFRVSITSLNEGNKIAGEKAPQDFYKVIPLNKNDSIDNRYAWYDDRCFLLYQEPEIWLDIDEFYAPRYLPVKIKINDSYYFGWIQIGINYGSVPGSEYEGNLDMTIYDYAYCQTPDKGLIAGNTIAIINPNNEKIPSLSYVYWLDAIIIETNESYDLMVVTDLLGQKVFEKKKYCR